jgi:predicted HTH domain antitoxin
MTTITLQCPDELFTALGKRPTAAAVEITLMAALKLYEEGRLSSGMAAKFAGVSRAEFIHLCGKYGTTIFQQTPEELDEDVKNATKNRSR